MVGELGGVVVEKKKWTLILEHRLSEYFWVIGWVSKCRLEIHIKITAFDL